MIFLPKEIFFSKLNTVNLEEYQLDLILTDNFLYIFNNLNKISIMNPKQSFKNFSQTDHKFKRDAPEFFGFKIIQDFNNFDLFIKCVNHFNVINDEENLLLKKLNFNNQLGIENFFDSLNNKEDFLFIYKLFTNVNNLEDPTRFNIKYLDNKNNNSNYITIDKIFDFVNNQIPLSQKITSIDNDINNLSLLNNKDNYYYYQLFNIQNNKVNSFINAYEYSINNLEQHKKTNIHNLLVTALVNDKHDIFNSFTQKYPETKKSLIDLLQDTLFQKKFNNIYEKLFLENIDNKFNNELDTNTMIKTKQKKVKKI